MRKGIAILAGTALALGAGTASAQDTAQDEMDAEAEAYDEADDSAEADDDDSFYSLLAEDPASAAFQAEVGYSEVVVYNGTAYLAGVIVVPTPDDPEAGYVQAFEAIGATLERIGSGWDYVLDLTTFHTDIDATLPTLVEVKNRYITNPNLPAWTVIGIDRLYEPAAVVEIKVIAAIPNEG